MGGWKIVSAGFYWKFSYLVAKLLKFHDVRFVVYLVDLASVLVRNKNLMEK